MVWLNYGAGKPNWVPFWHLQYCQRLATIDPRCSWSKALFEVGAAYRGRNGVGAGAPRARHVATQFGRARLQWLEWLSDAIDEYSSAAGIAARTSRLHVWPAACSRGYLYVGRCVRLDQRQQCGSARGGSRRQHHAREPARSRGTRRCCPRSCAPGRGRGSRTAGPRARGRRRVGQAPSATAGGLPSRPAAAGDSIPCATPTCAIRVQSSTAREYRLRSRVGRLRALGILWHLSYECCRAAGVELSPFPSWPRRAPISCPAADARARDLSPGLGRRSTWPRIGRSHYCGERFSAFASLPIASYSLSMY